MTDEFGEPITHPDGNIGRTDVILVDGEDIGIRFSCRVWGRSRIHRGWHVEGDPETRVYGNWIFARDRAYELSML